MARTIVEIKDGNFLEQHYHGRTPPPAAVKAFETAYFKTGELPTVRVPVRLLRRKRKRRSGS
ncbi:hypothetical protein KKC08_00365 [Patescibacteria group bacterium]|nr:hypothetical protein [Patescibacteria group bacterium]MBU4390362.1 hypothetical protein [Patescibacteria group bacterium]MBU4396608.1 hypothetical protein [Patescibacteria group bacterium]